MIFSHASLLVTTTLSALSLTLSAVPTPASAFQIQFQVIPRPFSRRSNLEFPTKIPGCSRFNSNSGTISSGSNSGRSDGRLYYSNGHGNTHGHSSLPDTSDPCMILNLEPGAADLKEIKRAYRRMALKYHPDAITSSDATQEQRKIANDDFARINAAYAFLSDKSRDINKTVSAAAAAADAANNNNNNKRYSSNSNSNNGSNTNTSTNNRNPRTSSHHQRKASHHQRVSVNMRDVTGFDINGNPRTSKNTAASSSNNNNNNNNNNNDGTYKYSPRTNTHPKAHAATNADATASNTAAAKKHDFYSSARARSRGMKRNTSAVPPSTTNTSANTASKPRSPATAARARTRTTNADATSNPKWGRAVSNVRSGATSAASSTPGSASSPSYSSSNTNRIHVKNNMHRRKHVHVNHATSKNDLGLSKGDLVEIIGGSYSHRRGKITNMYPTMVKVAISPTMDVLVENKYVRHVTLEEMEVNNNHSDRNMDGTVSANSHGDSSWASSWTHGSTPATTGTYSAAGNSNHDRNSDGNDNDIDNGNDNDNGNDKEQTASHLGGSGSYSNVYSTNRGQVEKNGNWVEDIRGSNASANANANANANNVNTNDFSSSGSKNGDTASSSSHSNHNHDIGSYSWTAQKREDTSVHGNDHDNDVQVNAHGHVHEHAHGNHHQVEVHSDIQMEVEEKSFVEKSKWLLIPGGIVACVILGVTEGIIPGFMLLGLDAVTSVVKSMKQ